MSELVIIIADLYLPADEPARSAQAAEFRAVPGIEFAARFGERGRLGSGWRAWLARWFGREDLAESSVARVAAASLAEGAVAAGGPGSTWIATPVELTAGLARVHLDHRGIVHLEPAEQAALAAAFAAEFGSSGAQLVPLGDGTLLLNAAGVAPVATEEPARCAGGELVLPRGAAAAPLLRLTSEIEMWLHGHPLNEARRARGDPEVTALWLWGAAGRTIAPRPPGASGNGGARTAPLGFGSDAWLGGLLRLAGSAHRPLPAQPAELVAQLPGARAVLVTELAREAADGGPWSRAAALAGLDRRLIRPVLAALGAGSLERVTLVANDAALTVARHSAWKRWRRRRAGLGGFL
ncbi:MAG TPA: hypothetical protein VFK87_12150 [Steroidobacteraceae bacterium]|nr:hypothetical protein [Steroidobacteraceae bacterium]